MRTLALLLALCASTTWAGYSPRRYGGGGTMQAGTYVPPARLVSTGTSTTTGLTGGGDLTADRTLSCVDASATSEGCVNTTAQTFAGSKTFTGALIGTSLTLSGLMGSDTVTATTSIQTPLILGPAGNTRLTLTANGSSSYLDAIAAPGGTSVAHILDTKASYATSGGKLLSVRNFGTEKAFVGYDGSVTALGYGLGTFAPTVLGFALSGSSIRAAVASGQSILLGSNGGTNWATIDSTGISSPGAFQSSAASGSNGLSFSVTGARLDLGAGTSDYLYSDGTAVNTATTLVVNGNVQVMGQNLQEGTANTPLIVYPRINNGASAIGTKMANQNTLSTAGAQIVGFYNDASVTVEVAAVDKDGSYLHKGNPTLQTCAAALEGLVSRDGASGVSTAARTRLCLCTSDGGGTPAYAWQNLVSGTVGTSTTCSP